jgi:hypothetical protein
VCGSEARDGGKGWIEIRPEASLIFFLSFFNFENTFQLTDSKRGPHGSFVLKKTDVAKLKKVIDFSALHFNT